MLQIPGFTAVDAPERHGGSTFRKRRIRELSWERQDLVKRLADSRRVKFPMDGKAYLPFGPAGAVGFVSRNGPICMRHFRETPTGNWKSAKFSYRCAAEGPRRTELSAVITRA